VLKVPETADIKDEEQQKEKNQTDLLYVHVLSVTM